VISAKVSATRAISASLPTRSAAAATAAPARAAAVTAAAVLVVITATAVAVAVAAMAAAAAAVGSAAAGVAAAAVVVATAGGWPAAPADRREGQRHRQVLQCDEGFRLHPARRRPARRIRAHLRGRAGGNPDAQRRRSTRVRARGRPAWQICGGEPSADQLIVIVHEGAEGPTDDVLPALFLS